MGERLSVAIEGVFKDKAGLCPRRCCGGNCEANDELRDIEGRVDEGTGGSLRCRSAPGLGDRSRPMGTATFLNVMVHSMSSPANTVESFHCTKTRMVDDMVGVVGEARALAAAGRGVIGSSWVGSNNCGDRD